MLVSMGGFWSDLGGGIKSVAKGAVEIAVSPITIPLQAAGGLGVQLIGAVGGAGTQLLGAAGNVLHPQAPAPPSYADLFGLGGGASGSAGSSKSGTSIPIIIGGVAAVGLLAFALLRKRGGKAHS